MAYKIQISITNKKNPGIKPLPISRTAALDTFAKNQIAMEHARHQITALKSM